MKVRLANKIQTDSVVDGPGLRAVIWTQGCSHACKGCHNKETWDFKAGFETDVENIKKELNELTYHDGITLTGGDPMFQPIACYEIAKHAKSLGYNVWAYSGFTFEQLINMSKINSVFKKLLDNIDVLVDGKFVLEKKSFDCRYRGSKNQRLIDVKKSLKAGKAVAIKKYDKEKNNELIYSKNECLFI